MKSILQIIILIVCVATYFMYISPTVAVVKALSAESSSYTNVLKKSQEIGIIRDNIWVDYNNISTGDTEKLKKIVPEKFNSVLFANDMNAIAGRHFLIVKDFKVNPQRTEDGGAVDSNQSVNPYKTTIVTFRVVGQYDQFVNFLKEIELSLRLVDVVSLSIKTVGGQKNTDGSLDYLLEMNTYSLR